MFTAIKKFFNQYKSDSAQEFDYKKYQEEQAEKAKQEFAKAKIEWETQNELEKKIDACYLGYRKKAFYGTYEEFLAWKQQEFHIETARLMSNSQLQAHHQALGNQSNALGYYQSIGQQTGIIGNIFGF